MNELKICLVFNHFNDAKSIQHGFISKELAISSLHTFRHFHEEYQNSSNLCRQKTCTSL